MSKRFPKGVYDDLSMAFIHDNRMMRLINCLIRGGFLKNSHDRRYTLEDLRNAVINTDVEDFRKVRAAGNITAKDFQRYRNMLLGMKEVEETPVPEEIKDVDDMTLKEAYMKRFNDSAEKLATELHLKWYNHVKVLKNGNYICTSIRVYTPEEWNESEEKKYFDGTFKEDVK